MGYYIEVPALHGKGLKTPWTTRDAILFDRDGKYVGKTKEYGSKGTPDEIERAEFIVKSVNGGFVPSCE